MPTNRLLSSSLVLALFSTSIACAMDLSDEGGASGELAVRADAPGEVEQFQALVWSEMFDQRFSAGSSFWMRDGTLPTELGPIIETTTLGDRYSGEILALGESASCSELPGVTQAQIDLCIAADFQMIKTEVLFDLQDGSQQFVSGIIVSFIAQDTGDRVSAIFPIGGNPLEVTGGIEAERDSDDAGARTVTTERKWWECPEAPTCGEGMTLDQKCVDIACEKYKRNMRRQYDAYKAANEIREKAHLAAEAACLAAAQGSALNNTGHFLLSIATFGGWGAREILNRMDDYDACMIAARNAAQTSFDTNVQDFKDKQAEEEDAFEDAALMCCKEVEEEGKEPKEVSEVPGPQ